MFNCHQARTEMRDVLLQTQGIVWALGVEQPGTEQHPYWKTRLAVLLCWPFSATSLSVSLNQSFPQAVFFLKKGNTKFLLPCKQSPHASPTSALEWLCATTPAPSKSRDDATCPSTREAWAVSALQPRDIKISLSIYMQIYFRCDRGLTKEGVLDAVCFC